MEVFIIVTLLLIILLILRLNTTLGNRLESVESELSALRKLLSAAPKPDINKEPPVVTAEKEKPKETGKTATPDWQSRFEVVEDRIINKATRC